MSYIPRAFTRSSISLGEGVASKQNEASRQVTQYQFNGSKAGTVIIQLVPRELTAIHFQWLTGERLFKRRCLSGIGYLYVVELNYTSE